MRKIVGFVTYDGLPQLTPDDRLALDALATRGYDARPVVWTDASIAWPSFDALVLRSCWDYHLQPASFARWLSAIAAAGVRLFNPADLALWNMEKTYLVDLARAGVRIVPTHVVEPRTWSTTAALRQETGWSDIILKPAISATAWRLCRVPPHARELPADVVQALATERFLAQPFLNGIADGEWSVVFFGGVFSHAVIKRPRDGEFRVQEEYGGRATPAVLDAAAQAIAAAPGRSLYARVDGILTPDGFVLIELELLEPALYLASAPHAASRFADAIFESLLFR